MTTRSTTAGPVLSGRYSVGKLIGRGGMGEVFSGWDKVLDRPVAIKVLREDMATNPLVRRRFEAEAKAAARLAHPNIVQVYDSGEDAGVPFIVMEKLSGNSLREEIRFGRLTVTDTVALALQVLAALESAHRAGLVHRDIKPANILGVDRGRWKVADFGIAKSVQPTPGDETVTGMLLGTPAYLPPERLLGGDASAGGDVYAVGVILYEALAGKKPFDSPGPEGWLVAATTTPAPLRDARPDVPPGLGALIERSLSRDPSQRFTTAHEMARAIRTEMNQGGSVQSVDEGTGWRAVPPATPVDNGDTELLPRLEKNPQRVRVLGIAGLVAAVLAATIWLAVAERPARSRTPPAPTAPVVQATTVPTPTTVQGGSARHPGKGHSNGQGGGGDQGDGGG